LVIFVPETVRPQLLKLGMQFDFSEITTPHRFEDLVASYFLEVSDRDKTAGLITVVPPGAGPDGGRDIFLIIPGSDGIATFERKWIVQCKFKERNVSAAELADTNIPTLLHSCGAQGYLLVCRSRPTAKLVAILAGMERHCPFGRAYRVWSGEELKRNILAMNGTNLLQQFFPAYYHYYISSLAPRT
jgi:hypothetical protein